MTGMSPAEDSKRAVIAADLREQIASGRLRPGDKVPSEAVLAEKHGVSRMTARRAVEELRTEGLLVSYEDRRGTVVREYAPLLTMLTAIERGRLDDPALAVDDWAARVRAQGRSPRQVVTVHADVPAPAAVVEQLPERVGLHVAAGESVVRRERLRLDEDSPVQVSDSWFPRWVADTPMLADPSRTPLREDGDVVLPGGILESIGLPQVRLAGRITARAATPEVQRLMDLPRGTLMLVLSLVGYDARDRPVRLEVRQAPTDRNVLGFEVIL
jgi:DNA-binding GntR family transcriptional regulator